MNLKHIVILEFTSHQMYADSATAGPGQLEGPLRFTAAAEVLEI